MTKLWWAHASVFQGLESNDRHRLQQLMHLARYDTDKVVYSSSLPGDVLYLIQKGSVRLFQQTPNQSRRALCELFQGDLFGSLSLIQSGYKNGLALTQSPTQMLVLRKNAFEQLMKYYPSLGARLIEGLEENQNQQMSAQLETRHTCQRLCRLLLHYLDNPDYQVDGQQSDFPLDLRELARHLGCERKAVSLCLAKLEQRGVIQQSAQSLHLCDRQALLKEI